MRILSFRNYQDTELFLFVYFLSNYFRILNIFGQIHFFLNLELIFNVNLINQKGYQLTIHNFNNQTNYLILLTTHSNIHEF